MSIDCLEDAAFQGHSFFERISVRNPLEHYRLCRSLLFQVQSREKIERALRYPFVQTYQPSIAAAALLSKTLGQAFPPVIPRLLPSGAPCAMTEEWKGEDSLLPIPIAEQLSILWRELGFIEQAEKAKIWADRFKGSARQLYYSERSFLSSEASSRGDFGTSADSQLGLASLISSFEQDVALSLTGWNSALGSMRFGDVSIPAFGPQIAPLSDAGGFGISQIRAHGSAIITEKDRFEMEGWTRCHGSKETWLHLKARVEKRFLDLDLRFSATEILTRIAFFVQADRSLLGNRVFVPGSLERYQGKTEPLLFNGHLHLECNREDQELQVIPLAGKDCFWNANFLIAFTCPRMSESHLDFHLDC